MKKLLIFIALLCSAAMASNDPPVLVIHGPEFIATSSYSVKYHMGVGGHLNGIPKGRTWQVRDEDDVPQNKMPISDSNKNDMLRWQKNEEQFYTTNSFNNYYWYYKINTKEDISEEDIFQAKYGD